MKVTELHCRSPFESAYGNITLGRRILCSRQLTHLKRPRRPIRCLIWALRKSAGCDHQLNQRVGSAHRSTCQRIWASLGNSGYAKCSAHQIFVFQTREYQGSLGLAQTHCLRFALYVFGFFDVTLGERFGDHPSKFVRSASSRLSLHLIFEENVVWWREFTGHASSIRRHLRKIG